MVRVGIEFNEPSLTRQEFKDECDVNNIVARYRDANGVDLVDSFNFAIGGSYGDFSDVPDFRAAKEIVMRAEAEFMALPAKVRARFENDPAQFVDFLNDEKNLNEAVALGLVQPKAVLQPETGIVNTVVNKKVEGES